MWYLGEALVRQNQGLGVGIARGAGSGLSRNDDTASSSHRNVPRGTLPQHSRLKRVTHGTHRRFGSTWNIRPKPRRHHAAQRKAGRKGPGPEFPMPGGPMLAVGHHDPPPHASLARRSFRDQCTQDSARSGRSLLAHSSPTPRQLTISPTGTVRCSPTPHVPRGTEDPVVGL